MEVNAPVRMTLSLVNILSRFGASMPSYRVFTRGRWARHRFSLAERDGSSICADRRQRLQAQVLTFLGAAEREERCQGVLSHQPRLPDTIVGVNDLTAQDPIVPSENPRIPHGTKLGSEEGTGGGEEHRSGVSA